MSELSKIIIVYEICFLTAWLICIDKNEDIYIDVLLMSL